MNLFLLSKYFTPEVNERFLEVVGKKPEDIKIAFSDNAADSLKIDGEALPYVEDAFEELKSFGFQLGRIDLRGYAKDIDRLVGKLSDYDAIYFSGGMYLGLLKVFHETGLIDRYVELLKNGLVHIGASAGAVIVSDDMNYCKEIEMDPDYQGEFYEKGLGLFKHYVCPHYSNKPKYTKLFERAIKSFPDDSVKFIPLENHQAVHATESDWEII